MHSKKRRSSNDSLEFILMEKRFYPGTALDSFIDESLERKGEGDIIPTHKHAQGEKNAVPDPERIDAEKR